MARLILGMMMRARWPASLIPLKISPRSTPVVLNALMFVYAA